MQSNPASDRYVQFVQRVHSLIGMAYGAQDKAVLCSASEEDISGRLVRTVRETLDHAPQTWMDNFFICAEDPVEGVKNKNGGTRKGKARPRIDIYVECSGQSPRPRFSFEAKCLKQRSDGVSAYLGEEGLRVFLDGNKRHVELAGMLAYVQQGTVQEHEQKLERGLHTRREELGLHATDAVWQEAPQDPSLRTLRSQHRRTHSSSLQIFHSLLLCHPQPSP